MSQEASADLEVGQSWSYNFTDYCNEDLCAWDSESVAVSKDGDFISIGGNSHISLFSNTKTNGPLWSLNDDAYNKSQTTALSYHGKYLAVGSLDYFHLFDTSSTTPMFSYEINQVGSVAISDDGLYSVAGSYDNYSVHVFDREGLIWEWEGCRVNEVDISSDGDKIVYVCRDQTQPIESSICIHATNDTSDDCQPLTDKRALTTAISNDGQYVVVGGEGDIPFVNLYEHDGEELNLLWSIEPSCEGSNGRIWEVDISEDGEYILASGPGGIFLYNNAGNVQWCKVHEMHEGGGFASGDLSINLGRIHGVGGSDSTGGIYVGYDLNGNETKNFTSEFDCPCDMNAVISDNSYIVVDAGAKDGNDYGVLYVFDAKTFIDIESITPNPAYYLEEIFFVGTVDENVTAVDFYWNSSIDGVLSHNQNFSTDSMSLGSHIITFTAKSSDGDWAVPRFEMVNVVLGLSIILDSMYEGIEYPFAIDGYNEDEYEYTWDFGDGTTEEGKEVLHTYSDNGSFDIKVKVNLGDFEIEITENDVLVDNSAPIITIISYPQTVEEGEEYNVIVNITDLGDDNFSFQYGIIGSDDWDTVDCYRTCVYVSPTTWHREAGIYVGLMDAGDEDGAAWVDAIEINVTNIPPEITNVSFPEELYQYEMGHFSADIYDSEWDIIEASWGFEESRGDKLFFVDTYHTFQNPGTHIAELCVNDEADTTCVAYTVDVLPAGLVEIVSITPPEKIEKDGEANFVANCYHCQDADIVWTSSIDGNISNNLNFSISDLSLGHHTLTLNAAHKEGRWSSQQTYGNFWVYTKPIAIAGQDSTGTPGVPLQFSGAGTDEDGTVVLYEWDFDGDGVFEWSSTENGRELNIYNNEETYTATLRVTDNDGFTGTDTVEIIISEKKIQIDDDGNVTVTDAGEDEEGIPGFGIIAAMVSIGLIARFRRR